MRRFKVTTAILRQATIHKIRRPSKAIQLGEIIEFNFNTDTVKAVVKTWDEQKACLECVLYGKGDKPTRCVLAKDSDGCAVPLCCSGKRFSFVFASIDDIMEEL